MTWPVTGVVVERGLLPDDLIDAYCKLRAPMGAHGWPDCTPYMRHAEIRDLCLYGPLVERIDSLVGEPSALHLILSGWTSTERAWHGDVYLSPAEVGARYAGVWIALDDIHLDAGPFEYVPGSHLWPPLTRADVFARLTPDEQADPDWPRRTEDWVGAHWEHQIREHGVEPERFLGRRGDVLIWHSHLIHRGSPPNVPGMERRSLIAHFSGRREDMPNVVEYGAGRYIAL